MIPFGHVSAAIDARGRQQGKRHSPMQATQSEALSHRSRSRRLKRNHFHRIVDTICKSRSGPAPDRLRRRGCLQPKKGRGETRTRRACKAHVRGRSYALVRQDGNRAYGRVPALDRQSLALEQRLKSLDPVAKSLSCEWPLSRVTDIFGSTLGQLLKKFGRRILPPIGKSDREVTDCYRNNIGFECRVRNSATVILIGREEGSGFPTKGRLGSRNPFCEIRHAGQVIHPHGGKVAQRCFDNDTATTE